MTSLFLSVLRVEELDDERWRLLAPLRYRSAVLGDVVTVPVGTITDMASVPRAPLMFWLTGDTARRPAVVHDYLYATHAHPRAIADAVFLEAMGVAGVPWWRRQLMYRAVRLCGHRAWASGPERRRALNLATSPS